jgi:hypothetical protein
VNSGDPLSHAAFNLFEFIITNREKMEKHTAVTIRATKGPLIVLLLMMALEVLVFTRPFPLNQMVEMTSGIN